MLSESERAELTSEVVWEAAPDALLLIDERGRIRWVNGQALRLFGYEYDDLVGRSVEDLLPAALAAAHTQHRRAYNDEPVRRPMGVGLRLVAEDRQGREVPVEVSLSPFELAGVSHVIADVRDMSDRAMVESRLVDATRRQLLADERERMARDLHDTVIQELFALGMHLQATLPEIGDERAMERVNSAIDTLDDVIRRIRGLIFDVNRSDEQLDIRKEIVEVVAQLTPSLGFEPRLEFSGPVDTAISNEMIDELLPIVREALTNVAKHAEASMADVTLSIGDTIDLTVSDDGRGLPSMTQWGNGLGNLTRRAVLLGGRLTVEPGGDTGTELTLSIPLNGSDDANR